MLQEVPRTNNNIEAWHQDSETLAHDHHENLRRTIENLKNCHYCQTPCSRTTTTQEDEGILTHGPKFEKENSVPRQELRSTRRSGVNLRRRPQLLCDYGASTRHFFSRRKVVKVTRIFKKSDQNDETFSESNVTVYSFNECSE